MPPRIRPVPSVAAYPAFSPPRAQAPLDLPLDCNEGLRPPPALLAACGAIRPEAVRRYPGIDRLTGKLAAHYRVDPDRLLITAGAEEALDRALRCFLVEGREIVFPVPSFETIERLSRLAGAKVVEVPWLQGAYPRAEVLAAITERTSVISVVTPNNPTGAVATIEDVRDLARAAPHAIVLLDLAYAELADEDITQPALELPNVVVVRSLSKAFGLAGLRIGCAIGAPEVIGWLRAVGVVFSVTGPSIHFAEVRLSLPEDDVAAYIARVRLERALLSSLLAELSYSPVPSQANFVFARLPDPVALRDALARRGIGIRAYPGKKYLEDAVRITCPGDAADFNRLCAALRGAHAELRGHRADGPASAPAEMSRGAPMNALRPEL